MKLPCQWPLPARTWGATIQVGVVRAPPEGESDEGQFGHASPVHGESGGGSWRHRSRNAYRHPVLLLRH